jgi:hypothetical protein
VAAVGELNTGPDSCIMKQESASRGKRSVSCICVVSHFDFATFLLLQDFLVIKALVNSEILPRRFKLCGGYCYAHLGC